MSESTIKILVVDEVEELPGRSAVPRPEVFATRVVNISTETLKNSIQEVHRQVNEIVENVNHEEGNARLSEITVGLEVSASGEVSWIAGIGAGVNGTISLTFTVVDQSDN